MIDAIEAAYVAADAAKASGEPWELVEYLTGKAERMLIENARGLVDAVHERDELRALLVKAGEAIGRAKRRFVVLHFDHVAAESLDPIQDEIHRATQTEAEQEAAPAAPEKTP